VVPQPPAEVGHARSLSAMLGLFWDAGLPMIAYYVLRVAGVSEWTALLTATFVAGARVTWVAVRSRRVTWFGAMMVLVFGIGLALAFITGDPRLILAKNSVSSALIGSCFLVSLAFARPLTLIAFQTWRPRDAQMWHTAYVSEPAVRKVFRTAAVAWGLGMLAAAALRLPIVYLLPLDVAVAAAAIPGVIVMSALAIWTVIVLSRMSRSVTVSSAPSRIPDIP
jgi:hypothetical protein